MTAFASLAAALSAFVATFASFARLFLHSLAAFSVCAGGMAERIAEMFDAELLTLLESAATVRSAGSVFLHLFGSGALSQHFLALHLPFMTFATTFLATLHQYQKL